MIDQTFSFSVAAGATPSNVATSNFNPVPDDGVIDIWGVTDGAISGLTALPSVQVQLGGATNMTPKPTSVIPIQQFGEALAGPSVSEVILTPVPVRRGTNIQVLVGGGTGATATGRIRMRFRTAAEVTAGA